MKLTIRQIKIFGYSDDMIEVEGSSDINGCDEFGGRNGHIVLMPTGDRFRVKYGAERPGVWSVTHEHDSGRLRVAIDKAPPGDDPDPYTDTAIVEGTIESVRFWRNWPPSSREILERVENHLENSNTRTWSDDMVRRVWEALGEP